MAKYRAEIEVPDNADWQTLEDAKLKATWKRLYTQEDRKARTDLTGKCGSCVNFIPDKDWSGKELCSGTCCRYHSSNSWSRTKPACAEYKSREQKV